MKGIYLTIAIVLFSGLCAPAFATDHDIFGETKVEKQEQKSAVLSIPALHQHYPVDPVPIDDETSDRLLRLETMLMDLASKVDALAGGGAKVAKADCACGPDCDCKQTASVVSDPGGQWGTETYQDCSGGSCVIRERQVWVPDSVANSSSAGAIMSTPTGSYQLLGYNCPDCGLPKANKISNGVYASDRTFNTMADGPPVWRPFARMAYGIRLMRANRLRRLGF